MNIKIQKIIIITVICLLIITSCYTSSALQKNKNNDLNQYNSINNRINNETVATCYLFNPDDITSKDKLISYETGSYLVKLFKESNDNPLKRTELISTLNDLGFINDKSLYLKKPRWLDNIKPFKSSSTGTSFFCSIASAGTGRITPPVLLPRPRVILLWTGYEDPEFAITSVGSLLINKGFFAYGSQHGIAIGFVGLGMTYGTPVGTVYGFTGYALYTSVTAAGIEFYPPNSKPVISNPNPSDGEENVPITLSELSFRIDDADIELMDYSVTTDPYIGSDSRNNVVNGIYSIPISGLQTSTTYSWTVSVSDGKAISENTFYFSTAKEYPVVSNPVPNNLGSASIDLSQLQFTLYDAQGDLMNYSVETSPYIGYGSSQGVSDGTYTIPVNNLRVDTWHYWYVNVTDRVYWTREKFSFYVGELGLVGYWNFDEGNGDTAHDNSEFGSDGNIHGASWTSDSISGFALFYDGSYDYVLVDDGPNLNFADTNEFTLSVWIKWNGKTSTRAMDIIHNRDPSNGYDIWLEDDGHLRMHVGYGTGTSGLNSIKIMDTSWHHIVGVWDSSSLYFYIDGEFDNSKYVGNVVVGESNKPLEFGNNYGYTDNLNTFNGIIDEIHIYERAITFNEIYSLYIDNYAKQLIAR